MAGGLQGLPPVLVDSNGNILNAANTTGTTPTSAAPTYNASTNTTPGASAQPATGTYNTTFKATQGWYMAAGVLVAITFANTPFGPFMMGVLAIALIYQTGLMLQHK